MPDRITKFIQSLDRKTREKLKQKLIALKKNPFDMKGIKKLGGRGGNVYRIRVGKIRIIYKVSEGEIEIIDIDYRGNIY